MELKDLQEFLKDEKNQQAFTEIVTSLGYKSEDSYKTVESDRDAERQKKREYQLKLDELKKRLDEVESKYQIEGDQSAEKTSDPVKKLEREIERLKKAYESEAQVRATLQQNLTEKSKTENLLKTFRAVDVDPAHESLLVAAFAGRVTIEDNAAFIDNKPIQEYFGEWIKGEGQRYKYQPVNQGAGAPGQAGKASGAKTVFTRAEMQTPEGRKAYLEAAKSGNAQITN